MRKSRPFAPCCSRNPGPSASPPAGSGSTRSPRIRPATDISLEAETIGGLPLEWSLARGSDSSRALLFFHGGGYCSGSIASHRGMVTAAGRSAGIRTLAVGYRLAPEHPFPAALEDATAAYDCCCCDRGVSPNRIAIGGDSAGAGLTLALLTSLRDAGGPLPACAWLLSPWVDLEMHRRHHRKQSRGRPPDPKALSRGSGRAPISPAMIRKIRSSRLCSPI